MALVGRTIALFMLLATSVAFAQGQSNWMVYTPKGPSFRIELPMQPTVQNAKIKTTRGPARATYYYFKGEKGLEGMMEVRDYDRGTVSKDARGYLDESREHHELRRPLRSESRFSLNGAPAHKFVTDTADDRVATIEEVVIDDRFISVICFTPKGHERSPDVTRIINSLALIKA
jgi:hypothetical protein